MSLLTILQLLLVSGAGLWVAYFGWLMITDPKRAFERAVPGAKPGAGQHLKWVAEPERHRTLRLLNASVVLALALMMVGSSLLGIMRAR